MAGQALVELEQDGNGQVAKATWRSCRAYAMSWQLVSLVMVIAGLPLCCNPFTMVFVVIVTKRFLTSDKALAALVGPRAM